MSYLIEDAKKWKALAENHLLAGDKLRDALPGLACYHYQQSAEKNLKAFLALKGHPISETTSLPMLIILCNRIAPNFDAVFDNVDIELVNAWATKYRYPSEDNVTGPYNEDIQMGRGFVVTLSGVVSAAIEAEEATDDEHDKPGSPSGAGTRYKG